MRPRLPLMIVLAAASWLGCGKPVSFQGQSTLAIAGAAPAPKAPEAPPRVEVRDNKIEIHEKIQFDFDKATIKEASFDLMNEIASVITKNPQIKRIRIEGHASSEGDASHNKTLSDDRAKSVMKYLTDHGVAAKELVALGYGSGLDPLPWTLHERRIRCGRWQRSRGASSARGDSSRMSSRRARCGWSSMRARPSRRLHATWT